MNGEVRQYSTEITEATEKMLGLAHIRVRFACFVDPQLLLRVPSVTSVISVVISPLGFRRQSGYVLRSAQTRLACPCGSRVAIFFQVTLRGSMIAVAAAVAPPP